VTGSNRRPSRCKRENSAQSGGFPSTQSRMEREPMANNLALADQSRTTLEELADRRDRRSGKIQREELIWCALNGKRYAEHWDSGYYSGTQVAFTEPPKRTKIVTKRAVLAVTASLDAAMGLVPEGWGWLVSQPNAKAIASGVLKVDTPVLGEVQFGYDQRYAVAAATPALALCAAALRARASQDASH
jgi:hypothetical protein